MKDKILYFIGIYGELMGLSIIVFVSIWDFLIKGSRGFLEYNVSYLGISLVWIGIIFVLASKYLNKKNWK